MSIKVMALIYEADLPRDEKTILQAYADHADPSGRNIFPAVERIAWKTSYCERSVQRITRKLEERGVLVPDGVGPHGTNRYRIPLEALPKRPSYEEHRVAKLRGDKSRKEGVQNRAENSDKMSPNPSCDPPSDPSEDTPAASAAESPGLSFKCICPHCGCRLLAPMGGGRAFCAICDMMVTPYFATNPPPTPPPPEDPPEIEGGCPGCGGRGWYVKAGHACDGTDEVCAVTCPVEVQVECECEGSAAPPDGKEPPGNLPSACPHCGSTSWCACADSNATPCPECGSKSGHRDTCSRKNAGMGAPARQSPGWREQAAAVQGYPHAEELERALRRFGDRAGELRGLAVQLWEAFALELPASKKRHSWWVGQLDELYQAAGGDWSLVKEAGRRLREGGCTLSSPGSLIKTFEGIKAERASAPLSSSQPVAVYSD